VRAAVAALILAAAPVAAQDEVPFVVTPGNVTAAMLDLAKVGPGDHVIDLGSGDGRIVIGAALRGARAVGYEIVEQLVNDSRVAAAKAGVAARTEFRTQDLFDADLSAATVITMYLLPEVNLQLRPRILKLAPGTRIVSHDWDMADWKPDRTISVDAPEKNIGLEKKSRLHLWIVPADFSGRWCTAGKAPRLAATISQDFQLLQVRLESSTALSGTVTGLHARLGARQLQLEVPGRLRITDPGQPPGSAWLERCAG